MPSGTFAIILPWVMASGYAMIFAAIIVGGPIFISAAAFAAALGYFDVFVIFSLAFFGELAVDILLYLIGRLSGMRLVDQYGHYFGLTDKRIKKLRDLIHDHPGKSLFIIKYSPVIPVPGFILTGAIKLDFNKFFYVLFLLSVPKAVFFTVIGYFFGKAYDTYAKYFAYGQYLLVLIVVLLIIINYFINRFFKRITNNEENKE